jgi:putative transposase
VWTDKNRAKYNRDHLRYPSDLTDDEWGYVEPLIPPAKRGGGKRRTDMRAVMNGVMYILSTGCQWRYIPKDFPPRSTLHAGLARAPVDHQHGGLHRAGAEPV